MCWHRWTVHWGAEISEAKLPRNTYTCSRFISSFSCFPDIVDDQKFWKFLLTKCCFWCPASNVNGLHEQTRVLVAIFWETCCCYRWKCAGNFISFQLEQLGYHCRVQVSPNTCHTWVFVDDLLPVKQPSLTCWCNMMLWYIAAVVESIWDPLSMQQTRRLTALVQRLVDNYPTVNAESKPTQVVYEWTVVLVTRM